MRAYQVHCGFLPKQKHSSFAPIPAVTYGRKMCLGVTSRREDCVQVFFFFFPSLSFSTIFLPLQRYTTAFWLHERAWQGFNQCPWAVSSQTTIQHYAGKVLCNLPNNSTTVCATGLTDDLPRIISYFEVFTSFSTYSTFYFYLFTKVNT